MNSPKSYGASEGAHLGRLRRAALVAAFVGATASFALLLRAGHRVHAPGALLVLMTLWVLSPFVGFLLVDMISKDWSGVGRGTLYSVVVALTLASVAAYGADAVWPRRAQPAFVFVAVPAASFLLAVVVVAAAALTFGRESPRRGDA
ncbi:MAG: hypothetical protein NVS4B3_29040 [Gemmatimonadaceae bacterium]